MRLVPPMAGKPFGIRAFKCSASVPNAPVDAKVFRYCGCLFATMRAYCVREGYRETRVLRSSVHPPVCRPLLARVSRPFPLLFDFNSILSVQGSLEVIHSHVLEFAFLH